MAFKINVGYGERVTSAGLNNKIASLAGKNFKIKGFETKFTGPYEITVSPGKCVVEGALIESDADIVVSIPEELKGINELAVVGEYIHGAKVFNVIISKEHYQISNLIPIANINIATKGCDNIDYNLQTNELMELLDNPGKTEYKTFVTEGGEEIVFDTAPYVGECGSEFDFVEREIVQEGLSGAPIKQDHTIFATWKNVITDDYIIKSIGDFRGIGIYINKANSTLNMYYGNGSSWVFVGSKVVSSSSGWLYAIVKDTSVEVVSNSGEAKFDMVNFENNKTTTGYSSSFKDVRVYTYNRVLTPAEIQHNLNVLNAGDENAALSVSENAKKQEVVSASIEGQTVKNIFDYSKDREVIFYYNGWNTYLDNGYIKRKPTSSDKTIACAIKVPNVEVGKTYTVILEIAYNGLIGDITSATASLKMPFDIPEKSVGTYIYSAEATDSTFQFNFGSKAPVDLSDSSQYITFRISVLEGNVSGIVNQYIPFGLSSTQAIITNNDKQYPICMPTIDGKTRVMKATKGKTDWVEISPDEVRDTASYDYKLVSNNDLGSVPTVCDYIDRARKVKVINTKEIVLDGSNLNFVFNDSTDGFTSFRSTVDDKKGNCPIVCDILRPTNTTGMRGILSGLGQWNIIVRVADTDLTSVDISGFKAWLSKNNVTVRYQLATPIEVPLTDEEISQYDQYRKIIELGKVGDVCDTLEIKEDGSGVWTRNIEQFILNGSETWVDNGATGTHYLYACTSYNRFKKSSNNVICDKISTTGDVIVFNTTSSGLIQLGFEKNKFGTVETRKQWLTSNKPIFIAELATPITTHIPKELMPKIKLAGKTVQTNRLKLNSLVPGKLTLTVPTTPNDGHKDLRNMMLAQKAELESGRTSVITSDGEEIVINQGPETGSAAIAKIAGQTVRNCFTKKTTYPYDIVAKGDLIVTNLADGYPFKANQKYTIILDLEGDGASKVNFVLNTVGGSYVHTGGVLFANGVNKFSLVYTQDFRIHAITGITGSTTKLVIKSQLVVVEEQYKDSVIYPDFLGLNPAQATLTAESENGTVTTNIYEPTIKGATRVMKATKGQQNWTEISPDEVRDTASYDYKLVNNNDLGSTPNSYDYIDRVRKVKVINTKEIVLNGSENWAKAGSYGDVTRFDIEPIEPVALGSDSLISTMFILGRISEQNLECINTHMSSNIMQIQIKNAKLTSQDVAGFKKYLTSNPITVRYQLKTPIEVPLTDEEIAQYDQYRKIIELGKVGDVCDTLEIKEDGSGVWTRNCYIDTFEGVSSVAAYRDRTNTFCGFIRLSKMKACTTSTTNMLCENLSVYTPDYLMTNDMEGVCENKNASDIGVWVSISKDKGVTNQTSLLNYIKTNEIKVMLRLATPITTHIPKELMPQIPLALTNGRNELIAGGAVKPSSLEVKRIHGDKAIEKTDAEARKVYSEIEARTNGLARIVGGKIEGRTVKNYCLPMVSSSVEVSTVTDGNIVMIKKSAAAGLALVKTQNLLLPNTEYDIVVFVKRNDLESLRIYSDTATSFAPFDDNVNISSGIKIFRAKTLNDLSGVAHDIKFSIWSGHAIGVTTIFSVMIVEAGCGKLLSSHLPGGLNSSKAIIKNGDFEARVYDPETGDIPELSSVDLTSDELKFNVDGGATLQRKIHKMLLDGSENWGIHSANTNDSTCLFMLIDIVPRALNVSSQVTCISSTLPTAKVDDMWGATKTLESISMRYNYVYIRISKSKLETPDAEGFKKWMAKNPITMRYILDQVDLVHIPPQFVEYLPVHRGKNELAVGDTVKANITENMQLAFNDNIYDKAPIPTIENGKITGLYLPEIKKHFNLDIKETTVSNANLLINGDFQVWQRGSQFTTSGANQYTADRWCVLNKATIKRLPDGLNITPIDQEVFLRYFPEDTSMYIGEAMSLSAKIDGIIYSCTGTIKGYENGVAFGTRTHFGSIGCYCEDPDKLELVRLAFDDRNEHVVEWVKLEFGNVVTPLHRKAYEDELNMCQRYYVNPGLSAENNVVGHYVQGGEVQVLIPTGSQMRVTPTVVQNPSGKLQVYLSGWNDAAYNSLKILPGGILLKYALGGAAYGNSYLIKQLPALDAEIY